MFFMLSVMDYTDLKNTILSLAICQGIDPSCFLNSYTLYYDETNNVKKFILRDNSFNVDADVQFVLGGLETKLLFDLEDLKEKFHLQANVKEIKSHHIYKGAFDSCLKSSKLELFLDLLIDNEVHVHFTSLNLLYWSIVDILDSIDGFVLDPLSRQLKSQLYRVIKSNIDRAISIFYKYSYPDIKTEDDVKVFMAELVDLCVACCSNCTNCEKLLLEYLILWLKKGVEQDGAVFIQNEQEYILLNELTSIYRKEIYTWDKSSLIFDQESDIVAALNEESLVINNTKLNNYTFVDSIANIMIQLSDVAISIVAKYLQYIDANMDNIINNVDSLFSVDQKRRFVKINYLLKRSMDYNPLFIHQVTSLDNHALFLNLVYKYGAYSYVQ